MSTIGNIARRTFLIGSAAIGGGVAFGAYAVSRPIDNPLLDNLADGEAAITPYVKIDANGITLITPRADKGQGSYSMQAHLIAEELDIDPTTAAITPGLPGPAYYNGAVLEEGVPFPAYDQSAVAEAMRSFMAVPAKLFAMQMTGGSSTVPDGYVKMRMAGAVARETLKEAAAQRAGVKRSDLKTENGQVILPDGSTIAYTDLAADAAKLDPIHNVDLRPSSEWKFLGKPHARLDMVGKCTGTEKYGIDLAVDGMVHAAVRANPGIGGDATIKDTSAAEAMRGVSKVMPVSHGVAVIADNTWRAFKAVEQVEVEFGPAPSFPPTTDEIFAEIEAVIDDPEKLDHRQRNDGDADAALADGDVFEATYKVPFLSHAPMEPMNAIVLVADGKIEIWTGTQIPLFIRNKAAQIAGIENENVFVYVQPMGGSFGHKLEMTHVEQAVEIAVAMEGTPVKLTWSREEDMTHDYPRPGAIAKGRGKIVDGRVETFDLSVGQSAMAPSWFGRLSGMSIPGPDATITTGSWDQPFGIPNHRVTGYRAPDLVPTSSWRSVGASGNGFFYNMLLDDLIHEAGADLMEERLRLCIHDTSRKVLEAVGEMCGWTGQNIGENRGRGLAFTMSFGVPTAIVTDVTNTDLGIKIDKVYVAADVGEVLDPVNIEAQLFGGVLFGMSHAINCEVTYDNYTPQQDNYHAYEGLRLYQAPEVEVKALTNGDRIRGVGEPGLPPAAPSLASAIFAATGKRVREMPLWNHVDFV